MQALFRWVVYLGFYKFFFLFVDSVIKENCCFAIHRAAFSSMLDVTRDLKNRMTLISFFFLERLLNKNFVGYLVWGGRISLTWAHPSLK